METKRLAEAIAFSPDKLSKNALFDSTQLFYDVYCLEAGQAQKVHAHAASDKIYHVIAGQGHFSIAGEERTLGAGELVIARAGEPHGVHNQGAERLVMIVVMAPKPD